MMEHTAEGSAALAEELRNVVHQAEALLEALGEDRDEALDALRQRVNSAVDTAKARLSDLETQAERATQRAALAAETYVREHPWTTVAIALSVGLVLGTIIAGRGGSRALSSLDGGESSLQ